MNAASRVSIRTAKKPMSCYKSPGCGWGMARHAKENFLENLNALFDGTKLNDSQLAAKIGVTSVTIGRWRRGERIPTFDGLDKIARYFKIPVRDLFRDPTDPETIGGVDLETALQIVSAHARAGRAVDTGSSS